MRANEIMRQPVVTCRAAETVAEAARAMRDSNVGFLPVLDEQGRTLGILTDRDIAIRCAAEERVPEVTPVTEVMTRYVISCHWNDPVELVTQLMRQHGKSRIVVMDSDGRPLGVVSVTDLVGAPRHAFVIGAQGASP